MHVPGAEAGAVLPVVDSVSVTAPVAPTFTWPSACPSSETSAGVLGVKLLATKVNVVPGGPEVGATARLGLPSGTAVTLKEVSALRPALSVARTV